MGMGRFDVKTASGSFKTIWAWEVRLCLSTINRVLISY